MFDISATPSTVSPFGDFRGRGWVFLVAPITSSTPSSIQRFTSIPGTQELKGRFLGGPGTLSLYRYSDSPIGPYDELSYSPGWYEHLDIRHRPYTSSARRITKTYVSCNETDVRLIRTKWGLPATQAIFKWHSTDVDEVTVEVTLLNGEHVIDLTLKLTTFPIFTIKSTSLLWDAIDMAKLVPLVQPLLDGTRVPSPSHVSPISPLLQHSPLLKTYTSIEATSQTTILVRAATNGKLFPRVEDLQLSRYGLYLEDMEMCLHEPETVLDIPQTKNRRCALGCIGFISTCFNIIIFGRKK